MMTKGMEHMMRAIIGMLGLDAQVIQAHVVQIANSLHTMSLDAAQAARDARIARKNSEAIMLHLGLPLTQEQGDGGNERLLNGGHAGSA